MNYELFIAKRIIASKRYKNSVSSPIIRISILAIAIGIVVMLCSVATGVGLQKKIKEVLGRVGKGAERRGGDDRRGWHPMARPPFLDSTGQLVTRDRRSSPDRRVGNIEVQFRGRHQPIDDEDSGQD